MSDIPYIRVCTSYYKKVKRPLASKDSIEVLILWNKETIISDYGRDYLTQIPCYDGFCCIPSHLNYESQIDTFYNQYHELNHPCYDGDCSNIMAFIQHIFGDQYELGLDYIKILYEYPLQILPILCLVSSERGTGKTTFLNLMKLIFGKNMTLNTNDDFRSQFNSDWANKLLIAVDEVLLDKREDSERIKNLSTARQFKAEAKGKDRQEIDFFGKFILCSNNETSFIQIDKEEIRYWVIKVPTIKKPSKHASENFLGVLKSEISAFLDFLYKKPFHSQNSTRMWFTSKQLETQALIKLKNNNKSSLEKEMIECIVIIMEDENLETLRFQIQDLLVSIRNMNSKAYTVYKVKEILTDLWKLKVLNSSYTRYIICIDGTIIHNSHKGRFYEITKKRLDEINCCSVDI